MPWEENPETIRSGHGDKSSFDPNSFRTISIDKGIKAVVGCPKGKYQNGRCQVGMKTQSFLFSKSKGWTMEKAKSWYSKRKENEIKASLQRSGLYDLYIEAGIIKKDSSEEMELRRKLDELREKRNKIDKESSELWKERDLKQQEFNKKMSSEYDPKQAKLNEERDKIYNEIVVLQHALGIELAEPVKVK